MKTFLSCIVIFVTLPLLCADIHKEFFAAIRAGDYSEVKRFLDTDIDVNKRPEPPARSFTSSAYDVQELSLPTKTALHVAAGIENGQEMCRLLLSHGASVNARNSEGYTPLYHAVFRGDEVTCRLLIAAGASVDVQNNSGTSSPFRLAYSLCFANICELLLEHGASVYTVQPFEHRTFLHDAIESNHDAIVSLLIEYGDDICTQDTGDSDLLGFEAWRTIKPRIFEKMLSDRRGLLKQLICDDTKVFSDLPGLDQGQRNVVLRYAALRKNMSIVEQLLASGASPLGKKNARGRSTVDIVCSFRSHDPELASIERLLLAYVANRYALEGLCGLPQDLIEHIMSFGVSAEIASIHYKAKKS